MGRDGLRRRRGPRRGHGPRRSRRPRSRGRALPVRLHQAQRHQRRHYHRSGRRETDEAFEPRRIAYSSATPHRFRLGLLFLVLVDLLFRRLRGRPSRRSRRVLLVEQPLQRLFVHHSLLDRYLAQRRRLHAEAAYLHLRFETLVHLFRCEKPAFYRQRAESQLLAQRRSSANVLSSNSTRRPTRPQQLRAPSRFACRFRLRGERPCG